ncbi:hypothetical protein OHD62_34360 [Mesorhizobium sp. YC-39]|uniref:hypothetical protein n=1 Tax=unclassified Mesorhizobium TaxID=325217 RepID=UPI0021E8CE91|nr:MULTISPECIES: hypothetical protein [unclassified Mesorhizobium]MCV3211669.1 hypothetical protein [Mesorhizobium sp. YC-2]MCV3233427.1 hypothetical protein [Mesorhizobium sp. YC-39]
MVSSDIAKRQAASVYLKTLVDNGLLHEVKAGRENLYINPALMALLTERERKSAGEALFFQKDRLIAWFPAYLFGQQLSFLKDRDRRRMMPVVSNLSSHRERHDILVVWQIENHCQLACRGHFDDQLFMV